MCAAYRFESRKFHWRVLCLAAFVCFSGCNSNYFSQLPVSMEAGAGTGTSSGSAAPQGPNPGPGSGSGPGLATGPATSVTIKKFQPALAVRDFSCLACHANIQSNLITDFGNSSSWYLGDLQNPTAFANHYSATSFQTIEQIKGQVIVPAASVPASYVNAELQSGAVPVSGPVSLSAYLTLTSMSDFYGTWFSYFNEPDPQTNAMTSNVTAPSGASPVIEEPQVYIGAPTATEILAIVPGNTSAGPWVQIPGASSPGLSGLTVVTGANNQSYVVNSGPVQCSGQDVVVNGTLLLDHARIYAEKGGCRFYVTGSAFIEGPITYLSSGSSADPTENLQLTSATAILMGVGLNGQTLNGNGTPDGSGETPLYVRLLGDVRGLVLRDAPTSAAYQTYATGIYAEGTNIGGTLLQDASVPAAGDAVANSAAGQSRTSINFQHLLLNAPLIHSRYMGAVNGVIVAESAMFSLGEFVFNYDPVFENVPVLPALPYDILCTGTSCKPTQP